MLFASLSFFLAEFALPLETAFLTFENWFVPKTVLVSVDMLSNNTRRWIGRLFLPAALFCFVACGPTAVFADEADDEYELALGLFKQKRWNLASDTFTKFVKENPKHEKIAFARLPRSPLPRMI